VYDAYQPGPVMDFQHLPENFEFFHPNPASGKEMSTAYAGEGWRAEWSSAGAPLLAGSEEFTLDRIGAENVAATGSRLIPCGAKRVGGEDA
jgi:hypothetical protein